MLRPLRLSLVALALVLGACAGLPARPALPPESAIPVADTGQLDSLLAPAEAAHPGASGFRLVSDGAEAFALRAYTAELAVRSLDVQTYIWHTDTTGLFLAHTLLEAADRGVRVRLLLDDIDARDHADVFGALAAHPGIEVRLYNPLATREGSVSMGLEFISAFGRLNHRMHNKAWIADNRVAIAGGRNVGDEYFGASDDVNFVDLDFAMAGPVVREISASFDRYWNSAAAYPVAALNPGAVSAAALVRLRERLAPVVAAAPATPYARMLRNDAGLRRLLTDQWPMSWTSRYTFAADDPLKARGKPDLDRSAVALTLRSELAGMQHEVTIVSPYFVPGRAGTDWLVDAARAGRTVRILTNSLAANDVAAVHGGYARYRRRLLAGGVHIWELKPAGTAPAGARRLGSSGASLHTKALEVDGRELFVGSFNIDPRSASLNTEQGVLVTDPALARQLDALFERQTAGDRAWKVTLENGRLDWSDGRRDYDSEPLASGWRRFEAWLARVLPVQSLL